ncbi:UDP-N-acetylglucosamine 2-epimerase (non-hydrolyzing) [Thermodesulfovibrionales bacterium]|nr:UDP-N-acetylglucosamine 2-epimerase (non-hydrolyzing) [Thermodesulfovibrionales bacterium]
MKKILIVFGTRPEAIKMAPVIQKLEAESSLLDKKRQTGQTTLKAIVCVTAQHREMLDQVLKTFDIFPEYDLDIMRENQDLFDVTTSSLSGLKKILTQEKPDLVMVQGDTTTAFVAGLAAYYLKIPVAHVEAGLRTYNKYSPFPEEKNRHLLSALADYHFTPTRLAKSNLVREGVPEDRIWVTGNTVIDALLTVSSRQKTVRSKKNWVTYFKEKYNLTLSSNADTNHNHLKLILITGHRRENFGEGFKNICMALKEIAEKREDVTIVYPVHLNPNVQQPVKTILNSKHNIHLIEPLQYEQFVFLMNNSYIILTDSGGIQEEAPSLGKPVLVMRDTTERPEGIEAGTVKLVGTDKHAIINNTLELLDNPSLYDKMSKAINPYGDGKAAERIYRVLSTLLPTSA